MRSVRDMTPQQLRGAAFDAILPELGPIGLARFIRENGLGYGDYARERSRWLPQDRAARDLAAEWSAER